VKDLKAYVEELERQRKENKSLLKSKQEELEEQAEEFNIKEKAL